MRNARVFKEMHEKGLGGLLKSKNRRALPSQSSRSNKVGGYIILSDFLDQTGKRQLADEELR